MTIYLPTQLKTATEAFRYMLGGKATITIISAETQKHLVYRIVVSPKDAKRHAVWVHTNNGWKFVGTLYHNGRKFFRSQRSIPKSWLLYRSFVWAWRHLRNKSMPWSLIIYHENTCCRCGRKLFDPKSIKAGIGSECIKKRGA